MAITGRRGFPAQAGVPSGRSSRPFMSGAGPRQADAHRRIRHCGGAPGAKAAWFTQAAQALRTQFPAIRAVVYFESDHQNFGQYFNWRVTTSQSALAAFRAFAHDPVLQCQAPDLSCPAQRLTSGYRDDRRNRAGRTTLAAEPRSIDLREYWLIVRRRWLLVVVHHRARRHRSGRDTPSPQRRPTRRRHRSWSPASRRARSTDFAGQPAGQHEHRAGRRPVAAGHRAGGQDHQLRSRPTLQAAAAKRLSRHGSGHHVDDVQRAADHLESGQPEGRAGGRERFRHRLTWPTGTGSSPDRSRALQSILKSQVTTLQRQIARLTTELSQTSPDRRAHASLEIRLSELTGQASTADSQLASLHDLRRQRRQCHRGRAAHHALRHRPRGHPCPRRPARPAHRAGAGLRTRCLRRPGARPSPAGAQAGSTHPGGPPARRDRPGRPDRTARSGIWRRPSPPRRARTAGPPRPSGRCGPRWSRWRRGRTCAPSSWSPPTPMSPPAALPPSLAWRSPSQAAGSCWSPPICAALCYRRSSTCRTTPG